MNKLGLKLFTSISLSVLLIFVLFVVLANYFLPKYYIYQTKQKLGEAVQTIQQLPEDALASSVPQLEEKYRITTAYGPVDQSLEDLNDSLLQQLAKKRVTLNKFWITEESLRKVEGGGRVNKIYDQGKLKSQFYASFIRKGPYLVLAGVSMAYVGDTVRMMNEFTLYLAVLSVILTMGVVWLVSYRVTKPLKELGGVARDIAELNFRRTNIHTRDEIGELAASVNAMSAKLEAAHEDLSRKNTSLKRFMSDITHELKTPVSLIQAYGEGIQDGLDDGSYVATILKQSESMSRMIGELLEFSKIEQGMLVRSLFPLKPLLQDCLDKFRIELEFREIELVIEDHAPGTPEVEADLEQIRTVFLNLLGNAVKYTADRRIHMSWHEDGDSCVFHIRNGIVGDLPDLSLLWEPFYVLENSRNKERSGTGLGLAIVKAVLERHGYRYAVDISEGNIHFTIHFLMANSPRTG